MPASMAAVPSVEPSSSTTSSSVHARAGQHGRTAGADIGLLVARRDQHGDRRRPARGAGVRKPRRLTSAIANGIAGEHQRDQAERVRHVSPSWLGSNRRPAAVARSQRHES